MWGHVLCKSWKKKGCLRVRNKVFLRYFIVALHLRWSRQQKCSLHLLTLQSGSCEFSANDSGRWSSELRMEMGCGPNRAWSIRSSSPGLFHSRWFVASWDSILCLSMAAGATSLRRLQVPDGYENQPPPLPPPCPAHILTLTKKSIWTFSRRVACNNHQSRS